MKLLTASRPSESRGPHWNAELRVDAAALADVLRQSATQAATKAVTKLERSVGAGLGAAGTGLSAADAGLRRLEELGRGLGEFLGRSLQKLAAQLRSGALASALGVARQRMARFLAHPAALYAALPAAYLVWYFSSFGKKPILRYRRDVAGLRWLAESCPALHKPYWPPLLAPTAFQQMAFMGLQDVFCHLLPSPYCREILTLSDGQDIALDWRLPRQEAEEPMLPRDSRLRHAPVVMVMHGLGQSAHSSPMQDLAAGLAEAGFPVVVVNRRGYELPLQVPRISMFGCDRDTDEVVLQSVARRYPNRTIAMVGFSCGTSPALRYLAKRPVALHTTLGDARAPDLLCGVMLDPGYDIADDGAIARMRFPVNFGVRCLVSYHYAYKHKKVLGRSPSKAALIDVLANSVSIAEEVRTLGQDALREPDEEEGVISAESHIAAVQVVRRLSSDYVDESWHRSEKDVDYTQISVPVLSLNSTDDPVCVAENITHHLDKIISNPKVILCEMAHGGHGNKYGAVFGRGMASKATADFIVANWYRQVEEEVFQHNAPRRGPFAGGMRESSSGDFARLMERE